MKIKWKCLVGAIGLVCIGFPLMIACVLGVGFGFGWVLGFDEPLLGLVVFPIIGLVAWCYKECVNDFH